MLVKMMRRAVFAAVLALAIAPASAQNAFVSVIDDLPLMAGLSEVGQGVEFATPQGRIVEATAQGAVTKAQVLAFYTKTLPQLGWSRVADTRFVREGETLDMIFTAQGGGLAVRFSLAPTGSQ